MSPEICQSSRHVVREIVPNKSEVPDKAASLRSKFQRTKSRHSRALQVREMVGPSGSEYTGTYIA
jgi:hypothetical protein